MSIQARMNTEKHGEPILQATTVLYRDSVRRTDASVAGNAVRNALRISIFLENSPESGDM